MGNSYNPINDEKLLLTERQILSFTGCKSNELEAKDVIINDDGVKIRTYIVGNKSKPKLIWVHGYGGSGLLFFRTYEGLAKNFCLILPDIIGMGASTRAPFDCQTPEECDEYFVNFLEQWRIAMDNMTDFYLCGHSFGGYCVSLYALKYPQHLKKLLLISPIGFNYKPENYSYEKVRYRGRPHGPPNWAYGFVQYMWRKEISPFALARTMGYEITKSSVRQYVDKLQKCNTDAEATALTEYLAQIFLRPGTTERGLFVQFQLGLFCHQPLLAENKLANPEFPVPISFIYGDIDWVDSTGSEVVVRANKFFSTGQSQLHIITNSDHNMHMDNPEMLVKRMTDDLLGNMSYCYETKQQQIYLVDDAENTISAEMQFDDSFQTAGGGGVVNLATFQMIQDCSLAEII